MTDSNDDLSQQLRTIEIDTRHVFDMVIPVHDPVEFGQTPRGMRRVRIGDRGIFKGEHMAGEVLPGGTNWFLTRSDGVGEFSVRLGLQTSDGDFIYMQSDGYFHFERELTPRIADGTATPNDYYFREHSRFETSSRQLDWLNSIMAVGTGWFQAGFVGMSIHQIN